MKKYIHRIGIAGSVFINVLFGGYSNQTFSARNYDFKTRGLPNLVWLIDSICWYDPDHCYYSWLFWKKIREYYKSENAFR